MILAEAISNFELIKEFLVQRGPYLLFIFLVMFGFYLMLTHRNTLKGMVGLVIFQTGIIIFFIFLSVIGSKGGLTTLPILDDEHVKATKADKVLQTELYNETAEKKKSVDEKTLKYKKYDVSKIKEHAGSIKSNEVKRNRELVPSEGMEAPNPAFKDSRRMPHMMSAVAQKPVHNPLPHALMLTAIVVGVATLGVAIAIMMRMNKELGTIEDRPLEGEDDE